MTTESNKLTALDLMPLMLEHPGRLLHPLADLVDEHSAESVVAALAGLLADKQPELSAKLNAAIGR